MSSFIPAGRTSLVKKGKIDFQVQTEYAFRPYPRLTTSISNNGQVVHKIEKRLGKGIESFEEQNHTEGAIQKQHREVLEIIVNGAREPEDVNANNEDHTIIGYERVPQVKLDIPTLDNACLTLMDRIKNVPGVNYVFELDGYGEFTNQSLKDSFKRKYAFVFKNLRDILQVFSAVPGREHIHQTGVYVIEERKLYLISSGDMFYFVTLSDFDRSLNYEKAFKSIF